MKKLLVLSFVGALAACQQQPAPEPTPTATETEATPLTANGSPPGVYEATSADGTVTTTTINADGTYTDTDASGKVLAMGAWSVKDGKTCFTPTGGSAEPQCYTETAPAADGSFTVTSDKGETQSVKPAASEAAPDASASASE
ncbi:hypothetical protein RXV95_09805 [Novosphingobium sp. ZN18A2]|uniref:hypothetical protein n=1 Tax=Novosphingobium sp. ZN18A2 TaxID=3079861 RepID=UPI0030D3D4FF